MAARSRGWSGRGGMGRSLSCSQYVLGPGLPKVKDSARVPPSRPVPAFAIPAPDATRWGTSNHEKSTLPRIAAAAALALALTGCSVTPRIVAQTPAMAVVESDPNVQLRRGNWTRRALPGGRAQRRAAGDEDGHPLRDPLRLRMRLARTAPAAAGAGQADAAALPRAVQRPVRPPPGPPGLTSRCAPDCSARGPCRRTIRSASAWPRYRSPAVP